VDRPAYNALIFSNGMCGIYGMVAMEHPVLRSLSLIERMGERLRHRGPDGHATVSDESGALGTERLRIIDLHARADQPFTSPEGEIWLACNGEIYNAASIRARYPDYPFRSGSDVESIIPLYLDKGPACIEELDGMFGLAIRDHRTGELILARDRAGEKPLFIAEVAGEITFASELQCLLEDPAVPRELDDVAIAEYLRLGYVPEPRTMFRSIRRIEAGTYTIFRGVDRTTVRYWDPDSFLIEPCYADEAVREVRRLFERSIAKQVMSDVPVGVFISGGLDSSILATLAARNIGADRVHTFSAQFAAASYDESTDAAVLARRIGTKHVAVPIDDVTLPEALERVIRDVAEPIADPAILPTYLLARAARQYVTVILSGEGADELFGGYPTYLGHKLAPLYGGLPAPLRRVLRGGIAALPSSSKKITLEFLLKKFVTDAERPWIDRHLSWFGSGLPADIFAGAPPAMPELPRAPFELDPLAGAMLVDYRSYLRDNLLVKVDRATMLNSVEARAPYLDRDLTKFALSLPASIRLRRATTKWVLKKAAEAWLPSEVIYRRKRGLSVPVAAWINAGLRSEVDRLLSPEALRDVPMIEPATVKRLLDEHRSGVANHAKAIWTLVMLMYWRERWT
jgi:asparagine synthase (glutamine-hydrolysing)